MKKAKFVIIIALMIASLACLAGCSEHTHSFGEWTVKTAPTCDTDGLEMRECSCGEKEERPLTKLGCDLGDWIVEREASCAEAGREIRVCKREGCKTLEERPIEKLPHTFGEWKLEREPSCFVEGLEARTCSGCPEREERLTGRLNDHQLTDWKVLREPTCTLEGLKERHCECGEKEEQTIPKLEHAFGEWKTESDATCIEKGVEARYCECGEREERHTDLADHAFGAWVFTEPSCSADGLKVRECFCGEKEEVVLPKTDHKYGKWITVASSSCIARGKQIRRCGCGDTQYQYLEKIDHVPVTDPAVPPSTSSTGLTEGSHCSVCGHVLVEQQVIDKLPTKKDVEMLSSFSYEGYSDKLVFYWSSHETYTGRLKKINITVNNGRSNQTFTVDASAKSWEFVPENEHIRYTFSASPIDKNDYQGNALSRTCYWMPDAKAMSFPRVEITTQYGELPTYKPSGGPSGTWGGGIRDANYVPSLVSVYNENDELLYRSATSDFSKAKIKVRGNTSARSSKEPFKIKLDKKADLLAGLVERDETKDYRDKNWLLLKIGYNMDLAMGHTMSKLVGRDYTPAYRYVSLFVNGDFRGLYVLMEPVDDGETRCDISDTGYIIEMDAYYWNEDLYFTTPVAIAKPGVRPVGYTFKAPDPDNLTADSPEVKYIKQYMTKLENELLNGGDVSKYLDIRSCAEWLLVHDLVSTWDSGGSNMYLTKYDNTDGSLVFMGPNWDFDSAFWSHSYATDQFARIRYNDHFYMYKLVNNAEFKRIYKELYTEVRGSVMRAVRAELAKYDTDEYNALIRLENERWGTSYDSFTKQQSRVISWFLDHLAWMDKAV